MWNGTFLMSNGQMAVVADTREAALDTLLKLEPAYGRRDIEFYLLDNVADLSPRDRWQDITSEVTARRFWVVAS
jgi:hypothetical protein